MKTKVWILLALFNLTCQLQADTVRLKNGLSLEGKIYLEEEDFIVLLIYDEKGRVQIKRNQIESIEYDLDSKLEELDAEDWKGRYEIGIWAYEKGMYQQAIELLSAVKGKEGVGKDVSKFLGLAYDKREQFDLAYENYKEYLTFNPDPEIKARSDALATKIEPKNAAETPKIVDGLEATYQWSPEKWDNANPCTVAPTRDESTGNKMFVVVSKGGAQDKAAFSGVGAPLDLSDSKSITFRAYHNGKKSTQMAIALINAQGQFFESRAIKVAPNAWVENEIAISGNVFKSTRNEFKNYSDDLGGKERIIRIVFMIYDRDELTMYVDRIFFK